MSHSNWNVKQISDQQGRVVVITGATSGLGKEAARVLAGKNATVVMAVRNVEKGKAVAEEIQKQYPAAKLAVYKLDLSNLASVKQFAGQFQSDHDRLDVLINNAGIMMCPYSKTADGFEIQMGTNHFGHFALTGLLMPLLKSTRDSGVVVTSSVGHRNGNIDFSDIHWENRKYNTTRAYGDSKLANLLFAFELARKLDGQAGAPKVTAAHPGWTKTELQRHSGLFTFLNNFFSQAVDRGVLPTLRAAYDPDAKPGDYFGPKGFLEMHGSPVKVGSNERSRDEQAARKLWDLSEELTGITYLS